MMALLLEMLMKPFLLVRLSCLFGLRSIYIVVQTWIELLRAAIFLHLVILWRLAILIITMLSLPFRAFTALFRERMLEVQVHRMRSELDNILWERKELHRRLQVAIKERRVMEAMLRELENEHDEAIVKVELLEGEVHDLKDEIRRSNEIHGKALLDYKTQVDAKTASNIKNNDKFGTSLWKSSQLKDTGRVTDGILEEPIISVYKNHGPAQSNTKGLVKIDIQATYREIAVSRSVFSAILSIVVGIIVWEAEDPCMPLVVGLFTVVSMSLMSVVQFFSTIEHKRPASDAVALLSFNWFLLGALANPTLPRVARVLTPLGGRTLEWLFL